MRRMDLEKKKVFKFYKLALFDVQTDRGWNVSRGWGHSYLPGPRLWRGYYYKENIHFKFIFENFDFFKLV